MAGAFTGSFAVETFTGDPESDAEIAELMQEFREASEACSVITLE